IRKYHQPRPQRIASALEHQPAPGSRQSEGRSQAHARLHLLPAQRQSSQSLRAITTKDTKVHKGIPLWTFAPSVVNASTERLAIRRRRLTSHSEESGRPAFRELRNRVVAGFAIASCRPPSSR